ncbi:tyrosine-protein kinase receptor TYRO3 [Mugil cephalus]|uniref:tyrosine-protein kinase receptor TYRO3 n=1 Tax=Mugil cephalus TaxID=48193 RepID=UPI001FB6A9ED|nr:tyrosine-protein kinase receptor TYRO3 [Mugil cephalus]
MEGLLWILVFLTRTLVGSCGDGVRFTKQPSNQTVSQGNEVRLGCAVEGVTEPDITWMKDGEKLYSTDQVFLTLGEQHWETSHSVRSVQVQDAGQYWCEVEFQDLTFSSEHAWITVEGVPHFLQEPQDVASLPNSPFNLSCVAVRPPGLKCVFVAVLPEAPVDVQVLSMGDNNVTLSWKPGFTGHSELNSCVVQVSRRSARRWDLPQQEVQVPPHLLVLSGLRSYSNYSVRVSCVNEVGASPFSPWFYFLTPESVPSVPPRNLTFQLSEQQLSLRWAGLQEEELQGKLLAYKLQWSLAGEAQEALLFKETWAQFGGGARFFNSSFQVSACTSVGCGPWTPPVLVLPTPVQVQVQRGHVWVGVLLGVLGAVLVGLMLNAVQRRGQETKFGSVFKCPRPETSVSFAAARSFNRNPDLQESTLDSLCIDTELKNKLQDVLIPERHLRLGHMLGKGEFGSVREAFLKKDDSSVHKVAVKVLKSDVTSSGDIEQCLKEAANMKDFHHPNVIQLIGVSLQRRPGRRLPVPMVILPFMKHGDLHTFLLLSRLGDEPFDLSLQTLVQFMLDISRGMDYLSSKNIVHRDLAARNCMLDQNMCVCVADFGLSKKIYSGDYYRQGSVSKLPVKWIALESLADNVYTTHSDVWAFGVTMWEIMTRAQTPYPGLENSEIYEFLMRGQRLKRPGHCREDIYELMHSCWSPVPKCRPSFQDLVVQLEALWLSLSPAPPPKEPLLYVNLEGEESRNGGGVLGEEAGSSWGIPWQQGAEEEEEEEEEEDWLVVGGSGAGLAITGDYRYIISPHGAPQEEQEEEEDNAVINV